MLSKVILNGSFYGLTPLILKLSGSGGDGAILRAFKVSNSHSVSNAGVVDASKASIIALLPNDLHRLDNFILVKHSVEAELRELLGEVMGRDVNQAIVGLFLGWRVGRKGQVVHDEIVVLVSHVLIENDFVHALRKIEVNLR